MKQTATVSFSPVPLRARHDGWTPERQRTFVAAVERGLTPGQASAAAGMSRKAAYALRARADGGAFRDAWDAAAGTARAARDEARRAAAGPNLRERAVTGVAVPVFYGGRQVGEFRRYDDAALLRMLRAGARREALGSPCPRHVSTERDEDVASLLSAFAPQANPDEMR